MKHSTLFSLVFGLGSLFQMSVTQAQTIVCMNTNLGDICMELLEAEAPATTAAFLKLVDNQGYDNTLIHAVEKGTSKVIKGGAYTSAIPTAALPASPAIASESGVKNLRGTISMEVNPANGSSLGAAWFINVADNPALNTGLGQTGTTGATVFARVVGNGMAIVDIISKLPALDLDSSFPSAAPVVTMDKTTGAEDLVNVRSVSRYGGTLADYEASLAEGGSGSDNSANLTDVVCMDTNLGEFCVQLFPEDAPLTVANFLNYVRNGSFDNTIFHRSVPGFVIQAGGYRFDNTLGAVEIPRNASVVNEFKRSNSQGTLAMAKIDGNPDSATSEWFINLFDNSENLDNQNEGFTVFAQVVGSGTSVVETISRISVFDVSNSLGGAFNSVPLVKTDTSFTTDDFVTLNRVFETRRDLTIVDDTFDPADPVSRVTALTSYGTTSFAVPVRINGVLYQIIFNEQSQSPPVYRADTLRIIQLVDKGRPAASFSFDTGKLLIPSIRIGTKVYTNIELALTDRDVLEFTLVSFDKL